MIWEKDIFTVTRFVIYGRIFNLRTSVGFVVTTIQTAMINIKVKTIAGIDRSFEVSGDLTIEQFKEHIANSVNVPVPNQRIIYHGRILEDEKILNMLDLDGKTLHLVEKAPSQSNNVPENNVLPPQPQRRALHEIAERQVIIGTVAVPVSELNEQEIRANDNSSLEMSLTLRDRAPVDIESPAHTILHNVEHILDDIEHLIEHLESDDPESRHRLLEDSTPQEYSDHSCAVQEHTDEMSGNRSNQPRIVEASTRYFSSVFDRFLALQDRLRGHFSRYSRLLSSDPTYTIQQSDQRGNDSRFFEIIQNVMHMQSHAFHCLSELGLDFDLEPPRTVSPASPRQSTTVIRPPEARVTMHFVRQSDVESGRGRSPNVNVTSTMPAPPRVQYTTSVNRLPPTVAAANPLNSANAQVFFQMPDIAGGQAASFVIPAGEFNLNIDSLFGGNRRQPSSAPITVAQTPTSQQQQQTIPFLQRIFGSLIPGTTNPSGSSQPIVSSTAAQSQGASSSISSPYPTMGSNFTFGQTQPTTIGVNQPRAQFPGMYESPQHMSKHLFSIRINSVQEVRAVRAEANSDSSQCHSLCKSDEESDDIDEVAISVPVSVTIGRASGVRQQPPIIPGIGVAQSVLPGFTPRFLYTGESGSRPIMHALNRNDATALYHVDPFLPCSSRHFAHRRRFSSSTSDSSNQNEPGSPVLRTAESDFDMREFEETMEQLLRTILDNMRSSQANTHSQFLSDGNVETTIRQRTRHPAERNDRLLQSHRSYSFPSSQSVPTVSQQTSAPTSRLGNPVVHQDVTHSSSVIAAPSSSSTNQTETHWKTQVPQEWVGVIESDRTRQETMLPKPRTSFSDAYLDGMPAKRRKMIVDEKIDLTSSTPTVMRNIAAQYCPSRNGNDQQHQSSSSSSMDLGENIPDNVASAFQRQLRERMERRWRFDPNFDGQKYKNLRKYFEK
uniref:BCL2-associated athanogene 6 n=1 Tax=Romanomermis culicivorax TaxID=13658 RepID=A0A915I2U2_ROMCU